MDAAHRRLTKNIRAIAKAHGIVYSHVPDRAGVSRSSFWQVTSGAVSPTLRWMVLIAGGLDCDVGELVAKTPKAGR